MHSTTQQALLGLLRQPSGLLEIARVPWKARALASQPRGSGQPVLLLPGFAAGATSMLPLRSYLRWLGYRARGWRLGVNRGNVPRMIQRMTHQAAQLARTAGQPVSLVGWSLGGHVAREISRVRPDLVRRVVTLGTPLLRAAALPAAPAPPAADAPITAVVSRRDGIVPWSSSVDTCNDHVEHVEVDTTHLGMIVSPDVFCIVAAALATS